MRLIFRLIGLVLVMFIVAGASLFFLPSDRIARIAADQIAAQTGREVTLSGPTEVSYYPVLGVTTGAIEIANADWGKAGPLFKADSLALGVDVMALLSGEVKVTKMEAAGPVVNLERGPDGRTNWTPDTTSGAEAAGKPLAVSLERAAVTGATVRILDRENGTDSRYENFDVTLNWPAPDGAATVAATLRPAGAAVNIRAEIGSFARALEGALVPVTTDISLPGGQARFSGQAGLTGQAQGNLALDLSSTSKALGALGVSGVDLPRGFGQALKLTGDVTLTEALALSLRNGRITLDQNTLSGAADLDLAATPLKVNAQLDAGALDFTALTAGEASAAPSAGWSTERIDASALSSFNGAIALSAPSIDLGSLQVGKTRLVMRNDTARMVFDIGEMAAYGGTLAGEFVVNNRNGLSVGGDLAAGGVDLQSLLSATMGITRLETTANATLKFLGVGNSMQAIMSSLSGSGALRTERGKINGIDLDKLMRAGGGAGGTTIFDSLSGTFKMNGGNLVNNNLTMTLPNVKATGSGRVGLGQRDIDYLVTPTAFNARDGRGLAIPVRIRGPWSAPKISADLEEAINLNLQEEKKEAERKVREKVQSKIEQELGVEMQEGQSVEDAIEQKLKNEAAKGLMDLLGR